MLSLLFSLVQSAATAPGKAIFSRPAPTYVGDTGEIKIPASVALGYNYTIKWAYDSQFTPSDASTLILDLLDPTQDQTKPVLLSDKVSNNMTSFVWYTDPKYFKGDLNGYILRLYDSTCKPGVCVTPGSGKLVISTTQPFIIYVPPASVQDNPLLNAAPTLSTLSLIFLLLLVQ